MTQLELTERVNAMGIKEAIKIASNAKNELKNCKSSVDEIPVEVSAALLKLWSLETLIGTSLKNCGDELKKTVKKLNETLEISTELKIDNEEGVAEPHTLALSIKPYDTVKTTVNYEEIETDNGLKITMEDPDKPDPLLVNCQKLNSQIIGYVVAENKEALPLFKTLGFSGNPTGFESALSVDTSLAKYKHVDVTQKYELRADITKVEPVASN